MGWFIVTRAILVRAIFASHGIIAIWQLAAVTGEPRNWYMMTALTGLLFETLVTLYMKRGQEWKWFCPSVFFYLLSVVPAIWFLELNEMEGRIKKESNETLLLQSRNDTLIWVPSIPALKEAVAGIEWTNEQFVRLLEQLLLLFLILGRWLLPKGDLTHDQLSQLLLVYIGTAADIVEFFDAFKEDTVRNNRVLCMLILSLWSWSLLQFTLVLTATKERKDRSGVLSRKNAVKDIRFVPADPNNASSPNNRFRDGVASAAAWNANGNNNDDRRRVRTSVLSRKGTMHTIGPTDSCCTPDVYGIVISIMMQDAPFLVLRMLLIFKYAVRSYTNIFFTCKNTLVCMLLSYRLIVIQLERCNERYHLFGAARRRHSSMAGTNSWTGLALMHGGGGGGSNSTDRYYQYATRVNLREPADDPNEPEVKYVIKAHYSFRRRRRPVRPDRSKVIHNHVLKPETEGTDVVTSRRDETSRTDRSAENGTNCPCAKPETEVEYVNETRNHKPLISKPEVELLKITEV